MKLVHQERGFFIMAVMQWMTVDVVDKMKSGQLQIIDVREPAEYSSGHIPGARLIPLGQIESRYKEIDPNKETVVVCRSGGRSSVACDFLSRAGYKNIRNLMGGMNGWSGEVVY